MFVVCGVFGVVIVTMLFVWFVCGSSKKNVVSLKLVVLVIVARAVDVVA